MEKHTAEGLKVCNSGCKMAVNSMNRVEEYVLDKKLKKLLTEAKKKHEEMEDESGRLLAACGQREEKPDVLASAASWLTTEMKLMLKDDNTQIAKILMDGCSMGVQSITEKMNKYPEASRESISLAKKIVKCEEHFAEELKKFL